MDSGQASINYTRFHRRTWNHQVVDSGQASINYTPNCATRSIPSVVDSGQASINYTRNKPQSLPDVVVDSGQASINYTVAFEDACAGLGCGFRAGIDQLHWPQKPSSPRRSCGFRAGIDQLHCRNPCQRDSVMRDVRYYVRVTPVAFTPGWRSGKKLSYVRCVTVRETLANQTSVHARRTTQNRRCAALAGRTVGVHRRRSTS